MAVKTVRATVPYPTGAPQHHVKLVHVVKSATNRGFNGIDYVSMCGHGFAGVKWEESMTDVPTCVPCIVTRKSCFQCKTPLNPAKWPFDVPERCETCVW